jgi:hypothetical protein
LSTSPVLRRKVTSSGVIWVQGRSYYVSRRLAGRTIPIEIRQGVLVIDVVVPLHKECRLSRRSASGDGLDDGLKQARPLVRVE